MGAAARHCKEVFAAPIMYRVRPVSSITRMPGSMLMSRACSVRGVTLFELLVVLAMVGIVTALAVPAYRQHVARTYRAEAMTALLALQGAEETLYLRHGTYTADIAAPPPAGLGLATASASNKYALSVALAADGQTFIATATPAAAGGQAQISNALRSPSTRAAAARSAALANGLLEVARMRRRASWIVSRACTARCRPSRSFSCRPRRRGTRRTQDRDLESRMVHDAGNAARAHARVPARRCAA